MSRKKVRKAPVAHHPLRGYPALRAWLFALLAASLVLSVLFAARLPLDANPDEAAHRDYIRLILEARGFVRFVAGDPARFETHQPPLYYLLCVPVYAATSGGVRPAPRPSASSAAATVAPSVCPVIRVVEISPPADAARSGGAEPMMRRALGERNRPNPAPVRLIRQAMSR